MKLSEIKKQLNSMNTVRFQLTDGTYVPQHFHITEIGQITKNFIDCGGTIRQEKVVNFQLWTANDLEHRLDAIKLTNIISMSEKALGLEDLEVEVEYQSGTIGKYSLDYNGKDFILSNKNTACLASETCGVETDKPKVKLLDLKTQGYCASEGKCC